MLKRNSLLWCFLTIAMLFSGAFVGCNQQTECQTEATEQEMEINKEVNDIYYILNPIDVGDICYVRNSFDILASRYKTGSKEWLNECCALLLNNLNVWVLRNYPEHEDVLEYDPKKAVFQILYDPFDQVNGILVEYHNQKKCIGFARTINVRDNNYITYSFLDSEMPSCGCIKKLPCYKNYDEKLYCLGEDEYYLRGEGNTFVSVDGKETIDRAQAADKYRAYIKKNFDFYEYKSATKEEWEAWNEERGVKIPEKDPDINAEYVRNEIAIQCSQYKVGSAEWKACWEQPLLTKIDELAEDPQYAWLKTEGSEIFELKFLHDCFGQIGGVICEIRLDGECLGYLQLLNIGDQYFVDAVVQGGHPSCGCLKDLPIWWNDENRLYYFGDGKYYTPGENDNYYLIPQPEFVFGETRYTGSTNREASIKNYYFYMKNTHGVNIFVEESSNETP